MGNWFSTIAVCIKPCYDPIIKHATYCFTAHKNYTDLKAATDSLNAARSTLEGQIATDKRDKGLIASKDTEHWLTTSNEAVSKGTKICGRYEQRCMISCCPINCFSNYDISKKAAKAFVDVNNRKREKPSNNITVKPPPASVVHIPVHSDLQQSQQRKLDEALQHIIADDDAVGMIEIWGPRRAGKTFILKMINNSFDTENPPAPFDFVIYLAASSEEWSVQKIQSEIVQRLDMQDKVSVCAQATTISGFLKDKSFLVLLDGLRDYVNMEEVGLPALGVHGQLKQKVVITTRTRNLCQGMHMNKLINVSGLEKVEALELFKNSVAGVDLYSHSGIRKHVEHLVDTLRALPAELIHFGREMCGAEDARHWEDVIDVVKELISSEDEAQAPSLGEGIIIKLKEHVKKLGEKSRDVRHRIELAKGNGMVATNNAQTWMARADTIISDGMEPNVLTYIAAGKLREVRGCLSDGPMDIAQPAPVIHIPVQDVLQPSQELFVEKARQALIDYPEGVTGIWGSAGTGKTLLLKMINNSFDTEYPMIPSSSNRGDPPFDFVIYLTASKECPVEKMQSDIVQRLKIQDGDYSVAAQANRISEFLKAKKFLVLLDDLYNEVNLSAVGLPHPFGAVGPIKRKVVFTTRSQSLCMLPHVNREMKVPALHINEVRQLFKDKVGNDNVYSDPIVGQLAEQLTGILRCHTSELISFGSQLRGEGKPEQWQVAIHVVEKLIRIKDQDQGQSLSLEEEIVSKVVEHRTALCAKKDDVRSRIEHAERDGKIPTNEINVWLEKADDIINNTEVICVSMQHKLNIHGFANVAEKLRVLQECLDYNKLNDTDITVEEQPPSVLQMCSSSPSQQSSRVKILEKAMKSIKNDSAVVIGIWGPGGVGKTHLLKEINDSFIGTTFFDLVIFVTASKECSVERLQADIMNQLKLHSKEKSQGTTIFDFLSKRRFLLLLDDIWSPIDLKAVGIPIPLGSANQLVSRKVVLTTRFQNLCGKMKVAEEIRVNYLPDDEALQLFNEMVGHKTLNTSPHVKALAEVLAQELKGLPLALVTVGSTMSGIKEPNEWRSAIDYMKQSCCNKSGTISMDMEDIVFRQLKFSFDRLRDDTLRKCFLVCSLWPEDRFISIDDLSRCWMGLDLVKDYGSVHSIVGQLSRACLLESTDKDIVSILPDTVKLHDVIRDMALWISRDCGESKDKWVVEAGVGANLSNKRTISWSNAEYVSLMLNHMEKLPHFGPDASSMKLRILLLNNNWLGQSVFGAIQSFTALTYLDLRFNNLQSIPLELCALANLVYLDLGFNTEIKEVPVRFGDLRKLKFLYLVGTCIATIQEGIISSLKALQVIDLCTLVKSGTTSIYHELCDLENLKEANIFVQGCADYESLCQAPKIPIRYLEVQGLEEPSAFSLSSGVCSEDIVRGTLHELILQSGTMEEVIGAEQGNPFDDLTVLKLQHLKGQEILWKGASPPALFPRLTHLCIFQCKELQHISWAMYLPCLVYLNVHRCDNMKHAFVITEDHGVQMPTFPCLKSLELWETRELASLCDATNVTFLSLETISISACPSLKRLPFTMQRLPERMTELMIDRTLWNKLEWEEGVKSFLEPFVRH